VPKENEYTRVVEAGVLGYAVVASQTLNTCELGHFINSPGPGMIANVRAEWRGKLCVHIAVKDIAKDEELLVDYHCDDLLRACKIKAVSPATPEC